MGVSTERKTVQGAQRPGADAEKDEDGRGGVAGGVDRDGDPAKYTLEDRC